MLAEVQRVEVDPDAFTVLGLIAGFGGFAAAVIAIILAMRAQRTANESAAQERRRIFELEILRALTEDLDHGLAAEVWTKPGDLQRYELRLSLLSSRLPFWERVMKQKDVHGTAETCGLVEFNSVYAEQTDVRRTRAELSALIPSLSALRLQGGSATEGILNRVRAREPSLPRVGDTNSWQAVIDRLQEELDSAVEKIPRLSKRYGELRELLQAELRRRLAWDVEQAILTRVEARPPRRPKWWHRV